MKNATFIIREVATYLESIKKPFSANDFLREWDSTGNTITNAELQVWFQRYFGREQAYQLFREMECRVSQNLNIA